MISKKPLMIRLYSRLVLLRGLVWGFWSSTVPVALLCNRVTISPPFPPFMCDGLGSLMAKERGRLEYDKYIAAGVSSLHTDVRGRI